MTAVVVLALVSVELAKFGALLLGAAFLLSGYGIVRWNPSPSAVRLAIGLALLSVWWH